MSSTTPVQPPGQPHSKVAPIAQLTVSSVIENNNKESATLAPARNLRTRSNRVREQSSNEFTSTQSTLALVQRVLLTNKNGNVEATLESVSIGEILPPLTSSNEVDLELYAILAIIVKEFVNTWYSKITTDHDFVEEIIHIFAHCSRAVEQRLRRTDIIGLLLDEIPLLIQAHIDAYRLAATKSASSAYTTSLRDIYHRLNPHPALTPPPLGNGHSATQSQQEEEAAYRQLLVQGVLALILPTEDLQNHPLRVLVGDIIADLIIGQGLAGKVCDGWFLHDAMSKVLDALSDKVQPQARGSGLRGDAKNRLENFGLLPSDSKSRQDDSSNYSQSKITTWFWRFMQYGYLVHLLLQYVVSEFQGIRRKPTRYRRPYKVSTSSAAGARNGLSAIPDPNDSLSKPVLAFGIYSLSSTLLKLDDRMPWLTSTFRFCQYALLHSIGELGSLDSLLDRFLCHAIETHILAPSLLPTILRNLRSALFPGNSMGPPAPPPPSLDEQCDIKRGAAIALQRLLPPSVAHRYYATELDEEVADYIQQDIFTPFDDVYLNKHLVYAILELVIIRLMPELGEKNVSDLLMERGVSLCENVIGEDIKPSKTSDFTDEE